MAMRRAERPDGHHDALEGFRDRVLAGDCLRLLPRLPAQSVDMVLCDLPYGTTQNNWDCPVPLDQLWEQYSRVLKPAGVVALTSQGAFTARLIMSNLPWFKYKIVWEKSKPTNFLNARRQPLRKHEDICIFYQKHPHYEPQMRNGLPYDKGVRKNQFTGSYGEFEPVRVRSDGQRFPCDIVYFKTAESEGPVYHPTQKPVELGRYLIRTFTRAGDLILDNTCGSGSFLVAAVLERRHFIGMELNDGALLHRRESIDMIRIARSRIRGAKQAVAEMLPGLEATSD